MNQKLIRRKAEHQKIAKHGELLSDLRICHLPVKTAGNGKLQRILKKKKLLVFPLLAGGLFFLQLTDQSRECLI